jgi:hypothetical protein
MASAVLDYKKKKNEEKKAESTPASAEQSFSQRADAESARLEKGIGALHSLAVQTKYWERRRKYCAVEPATIKRVLERGNPEGEYQSLFELFLPHGNFLFVRKTDLSEPVQEYDLVPDSAAYVILTPYCEAGGDAQKASWCAVKFPTLREYYEWKASLNLVIDKDVPQGVTTLRDNLSERIRPVFKINNIYSPNFTGELLQDFLNTHLAKGTTKVIYTSSGKEDKTLICTADNHGVFTSAVSVPVRGFAVIEHLNDFLPEGGKPALDNPCDVNNGRYPQCYTEEKFAQLYHAVDGD